MTDDDFGDHEIDTEHVSKRALMYALMPRDELAQEVMAFAVGLALAAKDDNMTPQRAMHELADRIPEFSEEEFAEMKKGFLERVEALGTEAVKSQTARWAAFTQTKE